MSDLNDFLNAKPSKEEYRKKIFIVYEGHVTEKKYFTALDIKKNIDFIDCGDTPMCKVDRLNSLVESKGYKHNFKDEKIYVLDFDIVKSEGHKKNICNYLEEKFTIYYTNPCFELWLLLHFEQDINLLKSIKKDQIIKHAKKEKYLEFNGANDKGLSDTDIVNLKSRVPVAIKTACEIGIEYKILTKENLNEILNYENMTNLDKLLAEIAV